MKKNNKGFSLVELIIVIAIMAILAGALAPALIKYINKSRKSTDVSNAQTLATALTTALSDETAYDDAVSKNYGSTTFTTSDIQGAASGAVFLNAVKDNLSKELKTKYDGSGVFIVKISSDYKTFTIYAKTADADHEVYPSVGANYK